MTTKPKFSHWKKDWYTSRIKWRVNPPLKYWESLKESALTNLDKLYEVEQELYIHLIEAQSFNESFQNSVISGNKWMEEMKNVKDLIDRLVALQESYTDPPEHI